MAHKNNFELSKLFFVILRALPSAARNFRAHHITRAAFTRSARAQPAALPRVPVYGKRQMSQVCDKLGALFEKRGSQTRTLF